MTRPGGSAPSGQRANGPSGQVKVGEVTTDAEGRRLEEIEFLADGTTIRGRLVLPARTDPAPAVVMVHMLGSDRSAYDELQLLFADEGIGSLAIDLRGHGQSEGGPEGHQHFKDLEWQAALADVQNALSSLAELPETNAERLGLIGASIGANYALMAAAERPGTPVVALSAGKNYKGVDPTGEMPKLRRLAFYVAAGDDKPAAELLDWVGDNVPESLTWPEDGNAHGTNLLPNGPLEAQMLLFFRDRWGIQPGEPGSELDAADVETPPLIDEGMEALEQTEEEAPPTEEDFTGGDEVPEEPPADDGGDGEDGGGETPEDPPADGE